MFIVSPLLHLGVISGLLVEDHTSGPRVAEGELAVNLAGGARGKADGEDTDHDGGLLDLVLLHDVASDVERSADTAAGSDHAPLGVELVAGTLEGAHLAGGLAREAQAGVKALGLVGQAREGGGSPLSGHLT